MSRVTKTKLKVSAGTKSSFRRSINLERDHASRETQPAFVMTACTRRSLYRIFEGIHSVSGSRAWTITGPYGTGKSSFCLFLSQVLSRQPVGKLLDGTDVGLTDKINASLGSRKRLVPVIVTGCREPLAHAVLKAFSATLKV